ncbi:MAG TPA: ComF family protein [Candidatus Binataceae bacterium]|nr:ComF family protein [Candidatus Binataceae bacterium]
MLRHLINFIYPPRCAACENRLPLEGRARVCAACLASVERLREPLCAACGVPIEVSDDQVQPGWCRDCTASPPHFTAARAVARYRSGEEDRAALPSIIRRHKYGRDQSLAHALVEFIGEPLPLVENDYDVVIPVPLHVARLRWRGFNQAALIAATVARRLGRPLDVRSLIRPRATAPQTAQDRAARHRNVRDAFAVRRPARVANRRVLLIDDVLTTGSTVDECARTLLAAGARRVDVLALARVL